MDFLIDLSRIAYRATNLFLQERAVLLQQATGYQ
jgi:hypothetical protein